jgi:hypothetical protein
MTEKRTGRLTVTDVAAQHRAMWGDMTDEALPEFARPLPAHDWRFEVAYGTDAARTGNVTFFRQATAEHVAASLAREGIELEPLRDETVCVNDTDGDGNCATCARDPQAPCRRPKPVDRYAHLTEDERRLIARFAYSHGLSEITAADTLTGDRFNAAQERGARWVAIADELHPDPWDQAPDKQAYGKPSGVTNAMVEASHEANAGYVHPDQVERLRELSDDQRTLALASNTVIEPDSDPQDQYDR